MHWDDLRVVRAVYKGGSFAAAAAQLRINETTVARRLARLQDDLGISLFDAVDGERRPTPHCEKIIGLSEAMAVQAEQIANIASEDSGIVERRRIAVTDSVAGELLTPHVPSFLSAHPGIGIELIASTYNVDFTRWQADIAIRHHEPERGDFVISKLTEFGMYYFEPAEEKARAGAHVCAYPADLDFLPESRFLESQGLLRKARFRTRNQIMLKRLIASGRCRGVLLSYICQDLLSDPNLRVRQLPDRRSIWLLVQRHLRYDPATREVIDWIRECVGEVSP